MGFCLGVLKLESDGSPGKSPRGNGAAQMQKDVVRCFGAITGAKNWLMGSNMDEHSIFWGSIPTRRESELNPSGPVISDSYFSDGWNHQLTLFVACDGWHVIFKAWAWSVKDCASGQGMRLRLSWDCWGSCFAVLTLQWINMAMEKPPFLDLFLGQPMDFADFHSFLVLFVSSLEGIWTQVVKSLWIEMRVATSESFGHLDLRLESSPGLVAQFPDGPSGHPMTRSLRSLSEMSQNHPRPKFVFFGVAWCSWVGKLGSSPYAVWLALTVIWLPLGMMGWSRSLRKPGCFMIV